MRASLKEASVLSVLFLFVASSCAFYVSNHPGEKDVGPAHSLVLTPHNPILILGDGDFTLANGVTSGTGTPGDPYVIEGWEINASAENGIEIQDTRADFTIRNVYVHGGRDAIFNGIELYDVRNGCIQNSTISDNYRGIYSWFALADFKIAENNVTSNMMGVDLRDSTTVNVSGNNISGNWYGIYFSGTGSTISGNAISVSNGSSIYAYGSDRIIITNNTVSNSRGGAYLSGCTRTNFSVNLLLAPCDGLFISDSTELALSSNVIVQTGIEIGGDNTAHFDSHEIYANNLVNGKPLRYYRNQANLDIDNALIGQLIVANCTKIRVSNTQINDTRSGIEMAFVSDAVVESCNVSYNSVGVDLRYSFNVTISNSIASHNDGVGLFCAFSDSILIQNNSISENAYGVDLACSTNVSLIANSFTADGVYIWGDDISHFNSHQITTDNSVNGRPLYYIKDSTGLAIEGTAIGQLILANCTDFEISHLEINETDWGIQLAFTSNISISNCTILGNIVGVSLYSSKIMRLENSRVLLSTEAGIESDHSDNTTISHNLFSGNEMGVHLYFSNDFLVSNNNIRDNEYGVFLGWGCARVQTFHNNLINNSIHAWDASGTVNAWDDGYPGGGNYWDNYTGEDLNKGPNQDIPGSDGIGDTPFVIEGWYNADRYPLMHMMNQSPVAQFSVTPSVGDTGTTFIFNASSSSDSEGQAESIEVRWDFNGDDIWEINWTTEKTAQWQYSEPGIYKIRLEVRDSQGWTDNATTEIEVTGAIPEFSGVVVAITVMMLLAIVIARSRFRRR